MSRRWEHMQAADLMKKGMKVVEVGCGSGIFMEMLIENGCKPIGLELNQSAVDQAKEKGLNVNYELVENIALEHEGEFDAACFFQVLEHVHDIRGFMDSCLKMLKSGGFLVIGVPNSNPYLHRHDRLHTLNLPPHHMGLWDEKSLGGLQRFFDIELQNLLVEPVKEAQKLMAIELRHRGWQRAAKFAAGLPGIVDRIVFRTIGKLGKGRNLLAVYKKI